MTKLPPQSQKKQPGLQSKMHPKPIYLDDNYKGSGKLLDKIALVTGGDSGIGRAVACIFAKEGADVFVHYLNEHEDARKTKQDIEAMGRKCWLMACDLKDYDNCVKLVEEVIKQCGSLDILVNNVAEQHPKEKVEDISIEQMKSTFKTNFFSYFYMIQCSLPYLNSGSTIINTTSVTAYKGSEHLIDYSSTKGAIVSLTRSLSQNLITRGVRINAVAPGPVWTPLIPASFTPSQVKEFGQQVPMKRPGQPAEIAPAYVYLASEDSSYMTGQVLHPNGGVIVNS